MSLRNTLRKAAGLLVELPEEPETADGGGATSPTTGTDQLWAELESLAQASAPVAPAKTVEQIVRDAPGPNLDAINLNHDTLPSGALDFDAIYRSASLPQVPFSAEQVIDMMAQLPTELPLETRRQTLKVSINAMGKAIGATPESIVADASRKMAALAAYTDHLNTLTTEYAAAAEQKIASLQAQIEETRVTLLAAKDKQATETAACVRESDRLDDVLEFFSLDVAPSKYATPTT